VVVGDTAFYAHVDGLGNVIAYTDSTRQLRATYDYDLWGAGGPRFKGALAFGVGVELIYMRNRWYEPQSGRFLSEDPLGLGGGMNPYAYVGNDPVNRRDPSGLLVVSVYDLDPAEVWGNPECEWRMAWTLGGGCWEATESWTPPPWPAPGGPVGGGGPAGLNGKPPLEVDVQACFNAFVQIADLAPVAVVPVVGPPLNFGLEVASLAALESDIQHARVSPLRKGVARFVLGLQAVTVVSGSFPPTAPVTSIAEVLLLAASTAALTGSPDFISAHLQACGFMPK